MNLFFCGRSAPTRYEAKNKRGATSIVGSSSSQSELMSRFAPAVSVDMAICQIGHDAPNTTQRIAHLSGRRCHVIL
eukprot:9092888-Pyramimonas_sp.AAC.1